MKTLENYLIGNEDLQLLNQLIGRTMGHFQCDSLTVNNAGKTSTSSKFYLPLRHRKNSETLFEKLLEFSFEYYEDPLTLLDYFKPAVKQSEEQVFKRLDELNYNRPESSIHFPNIDIHTIEIYSYRDSLDDGSEYAYDAGILFADVKGNGILLVPDRVGSGRTHFISDQETILNTISSLNLRKTVEGDN